MTPDDKLLFQKAQKYAFSYMETITDRPVFPSNDALDNLKHFHELVRQIQPFDPSAIKSLNQEAKDGYDQAVIMEQNGRIKGAAVMYQEVLDIQPDFLPARDRLSRLYVKKREYQKALAIFQVENDPKRLLQMILSGFDQWKGSWRK